MDFYYRRARNLNSPTTSIPVTWKPLSAQNDGARHRLSYGTNSKIGERQGTVSPGPKPSTPNSL